MRDELKVAPGKFAVPIKYFTDMINFFGRQSSEICSHKWLVGDLLGITH